MNDDELLDLLHGYLDPQGDSNPEMVGVLVVWEREDPDFGARHIWEKHSITEREVEEVLFEVPPYVEARRHSQEPNRTIFWGATRYDRWLFIVCEDWYDSGIRYLKPITAFEPSEGVRYWERHQ
jgi:hypothetical protein